MASSLLHVLHGVIAWLFAGCESPDCGKEDGRSVRNARNVKIRLCLLLIARE